jgi:hypothetical protein
MGMGMGGAGGGDALNLAGLLNVSAMNPRNIKSFFAGSLTGFSLLVGATQHC